MVIIPAKNFVLLKPLSETKNKSGIIVPVNTSDKKPEIGEVFLVGAGKQPFMTPMKPGDKVLVKKYMSNPVTLPSGEVINPVEFDDLTALIKEDK